MSLEEDVAAIFDETAVGRISFTLDQLRITASGLRLIAAAIRERRIALSDDTSLPADAAYDIDTNVLQLRSTDAAELGTKSVRGMIVHESVHALIDMGWATKTTALTGEVAGYTAQILYRMNRGQERLLRDWAAANALTDDGRIFASVIDLIDRVDLLNENAAGRSVQIPWASYVDVRRAVHRHPLYRPLGFMESHGANGIPRSRTGPGR
jgi:hypothetical protein